MKVYRHRRSRSFAQAPPRAAVADRSDAPASTGEISAPIIAASEPETDSMVISAADLNQSQGEAESTGSRSSMRSTGARVIRPSVPRAAEAPAMEGTGQISAASIVPDSEVVDPPRSSTVDKPEDAAPSADNAERAGSDAGGSEADVAEEESEASEASQIESAAVVETGQDAALADQPTDAASSRPAAAPAAADNAAVTLPESQTVQPAGPAPGPSSGETRSANAYLGAGTYAARRDPVRHFWPAVAAQPRAALGQNQVGALPLCRSVPRK